MLSRFLTRREQLVLFFVAAAILVGSAGIFVGNDSPDSQAPASPADLSVPVEPAEAVPEEAPVPEEDAQPLAGEPDDPAVEPDPPTEVVVSVQGAVAYPGLLQLPAGSRVKDLLEAAGGAEETADLSNINLAARLIDGTTLTVPQGVRITETDGGGVAIERRSTAHVTNPPEYTIYGWRPEAGPGDADAATGESAGSQGGSGSGLINLNRASQAELEELPGIGPKLAASIIAYRERTPYRRVEDLTEVSGIGPKRLEAVRDLVSVR